LALFPNKEGAQRNVTQSKQARNYEYKYNLNLISVWFNSKWLKSKWFCKIDIIIWYKPFFKIICKDVYTHYNDYDSTQFF